VALIASFGALQARLLEGAKTKKTQCLVDATIFKAVGFNNWS